MPKLEILTGTGWKHLAQNFPSYRDAVIFGQTNYAYGFSVDTGTRVPSRAEQLLEEDAKPIRKSKTKFNALTLED